MVPPRAGSITIRYMSFSRMYRPVCACAWRGRPRCRMSFYSVGRVPECRDGGFEQEPPPARRRDDGMRNPFAFGVCHCQLPVAEAFGQRRRHRFAAGAAERVADAQVGCLAVAARCREALQRIGDHPVAQRVGGGRPAADVLRPCPLPVEPVVRYDPRVVVLGEHQRPPALVERCLPVAVAVHEVGDDPAFSAMTSLFSDSRTCCAMRCKTWLPHMRLTRTSSCGMR